MISKYYLQYEKKGKIKYIGMDADIGFCEEPEYHTLPAVESIFQYLKECYPSEARHTSIKEIEQMGDK